jgi:hypothetical protein
MAYSHATLPSDLHEWDVILLSFEQGVGPKGRQEVRIDPEPTYRSVVGVNSKHV